MSDAKIQFSDREALYYHSTGRPGKIEIVASKPMATQRDLSLAYSPGVAVPFAGVDSIRTGGAALRSGERHDEIPHRFVLFLLQPGAGCRNEFFINL